MKKFLKNNIKLILVFLLGIIVSSGITVYAVNNYMSNQIRYQNNTFAINNVSDALDDLYSYSKDKIDNYVSNQNNNYSTEEQVVGTWIDGKPIYQKTVTNLSVSSGSSNALHQAWITLPVNISDMETIIDVIFYSDSNNGMMMRALEATIVGGTSVNVEYQGGSRTIRTVTVQYTKTTDTASNN